MIFRQDFKKIYVRDLFLFGSFVTFVIYGVEFNNIKFSLQDLLFIIFIILFATLGCLSYYWYYFEVRDAQLIKHMFGRSKFFSIPTITELSYENNPVRPLVYITFNKPGDADHIEFTTAVWAPNTLYSLNRALQNVNPNINIRFDEKTRKNLEKDKDYHLNHPRNVFGWVFLGLKQIILGSFLSVVLIMVLKYL